MAQNHPETLCDIYFAGLEEKKGAARFLYKSSGKWEEVTGEEFHLLVLKAAGAMLDFGIQPGDHVAISSYNRLEWTVIDYATLLIGAVTVPLYSTLPGDQADYIIRDCKAKLLFVENEEQFEKMIPYSQELHRVSISGQKGELWADFLKKGESLSKENLRDLSGRVQAEDLATLIYTSGTTGNPKGVMLTHGNVTSNIVMGRNVTRFVEGDLALSFLPLSHIFERAFDFGLFYVGATIAYAEGIDQVPDNLRELHPTVMAAVPRFYEKVHMKIQESIATMPDRKRKIFNWALKVGREESILRMQGKALPLGLKWKYFWAKKLVLQKLHERVGGRLRLFISGGAPLNQDIAEFFFAAGFTILEGYGLSETSPIISINQEGEVKLGTVGKPAPGVKVKIASDGEILAQGPNIMRGYLNLPEESAAVLQNGWFHTGDIGEFDEDGFLRITDRKKDLAKTSGGKYIAPQPIELRLKKNPCVANAIVVADRRHYPSSLIVPNFEVVKSKLGVGGSPQEMIQEPRVRTLFQEIVDEVNADLAQYEKIKQFDCLPDDFSIDSGELTPTMKVKRRVVEKNYSEVIDALYAG